MLASTGFMVDVWASLQLPRKSLGFEMGAISHCCIKTFVESDIQYKQHLHVGQNSATT